MKTLAELATEIDTGLKVYSTLECAEVHRTKFGYDLLLWLGEQFMSMGGYATLEDLIADDLLPSVSQPVWSTTKTPQHIAAENAFLKVPKKRE